MLISSYLVQLTGMDIKTLKDIARVAQGADGSYTVSIWNVPNVPEPTSAQLMAALALPEPVIPSVLISYAETEQSTLAAAGTTVNVDPSATTPKNVFVSTNTSGLTFLSGALQYAQLNTSALIQWVSQGQTFELTSVEVGVLATSTFAYVQSTFSKLADVVARINSGTITTTTEIDTAFAATSTSTASTTTPAAKSTT